MDAQKACTETQARSVCPVIGRGRKSCSHRPNVKVEVAQGSKAAVWIFVVTREQGASCCVGKGVDAERQE